jgi:cytochrome c-type biogenesis protein CcmH/NrfG
LGWVYVKRGLPALALTPLEQAVRRDPKNPVYAYHLGTAHARGGDRDRARTMLQAALKLSPSFSGADDAKRTLQSLGN